MKNPIQFQKGMSLGAFYARFGDDASCRRHLFELRWPTGYRCPSCGSASYCTLKARPVYQCNHCHHQSSLTSGTLFQGSKLPLSTWFLAIYLLTQRKAGVSTLDLARELGVSQNTAWKVKHKLMQAMLERESPRRLSGRVEMDDAYWGGERRGGKRGRGAPGKAPFVAAVQTTEEGHPYYLKLTALSSFRTAELSRWAIHHLAPDAAVVTDGLACFKGLQAAGCAHRAEITGGGPASVEHPSFAWVNIMLGNLKSALHGTYHAFRSKHLPRYLAEFAYRFNRRFDLPSMIDRLISVAARTPPMPYRLLTMAETHW